MGELGLSLLYFIQAKMPTLKTICINWGSNFTQTKKFSGEIIPLNLWFDAFIRNLDQMTEY
jgi:hypothetical protein